MGSEPAASRGRRWPGQSCYWWPETRVSSMKLGEFCQCRQTWGSRLAGMRAGCPARRRAQDSAALWGMVVRRGRKGCTGAGTVSAESVSHLRQIPRRRTPGLTRPWQVPFPPSSSSVHGAPRRPADCWCWHQPHAPSRFPQKIQWAALGALYNRPRSPGSAPAVNVNIAGHGAHSSIQSETPRCCGALCAVMAGGRGGARRSASKSRREPQHRTERSRSASPFPPS